MLKKLTIYLSEIPLLGQNATGMLRARHRMRISAFHPIKNTSDKQDANLQHMWCILAVVNLELPALCYLGAATLWKRTEGKAKIAEQ